MRWELSPIFQHALLLLVSRMNSQELTSSSLTSIQVFPAKYVSNEKKIPAMICTFSERPIKVILTVDIHILLEQTYTTV